MILFLSCQRKETSFPSIPEILSIYFSLISVPPCLPFRLGKLSGIFRQEKWQKQRVFRLEYPLSNILKSLRQSIVQGVEGIYSETPWDKGTLRKRNGVCHTLVIKGNPYREQLRSNSNHIHHSVLSNMRLFGFWKRNQYSIVVLRYSI